MKLYYPKEVLLRHGKEIIDGHTVYLDGALALKDGKVLESFYQSGKVYDSVKKFPRYELKNNLLMPGFVAILKGISEVKNEHLFLASLASKGITSYLFEVSNNDELELALKKRYLCGFLGIRLVGTNYPLEVYDDSFVKAVVIKDDEDRKMIPLLQEKNIKVLLNANTANYKGDGYTTVDRNASFNVDHKGYFNYIFEDNKYAELVSSYDIEDLKATLKLMPRYKRAYAPVLLVSNSEVLLDLYPFFIKAMKAGLKEVEASAMLSENILSFYAADEKRAKLTKGYKADVVIVDEKGVILTLQEGKFYR